MIDPRLMTLLTLVKIKNYTKTAQKLFITQPAVTHHIKSIEKEYGINIFANNKTFELTNEGEIMVEYARRMINQSTQLQGALEKSKQVSKNFSLALTSESSIILNKKNLLSLFFDFFNSTSNVKIDNIKQIFKDLQEGLIDFAIVDSSYDDDLFDGFLLDTFQIVPVCYNQGKFKEIKRVTREMLKNNPLILGDFSEGMGMATINSLIKSNIKINQGNIVTCNNSFLMAECIRAKDGIGFMYFDLVNQNKDMKKMDLLNFNCTQNVYLIYNQNSFDKKLLKSIIYELKKWMVN